jgi:hypothetical protein
MTEIRLAVPSDFRVKSSARLRMKNAWALYVRRRWPGIGGVKSAMAEWDTLTEWEARTLFDATSSQETQDKVLEHPHGGLGLGLTILEIRFQTNLSDFLEQEQQRLRDEERKSEERRAHLGAMARRLPAVLGLGRNCNG